MILVYLEHSNDGSLPKSARVAAGAALSAKSAHGYAKAIGLLLGEAGIEGAANQAAKLGLDEIVYLKNSSLDQYLALNYEAAFKAVVDQLNPGLVLTISNTRGKDFLPRLASQMDAGQATDVIAFVQGGLFKRPMYAGNILADVEITSEKKLATVRATAFEEAKVSDSACSVKDLGLNFDLTSAQEFVSFDTVASERPELTDADIVVSAGRAIKSAENFEKTIAPLADTLGAAIGASRAAVDAGYAPNDWQVGQTGKVVAPNLYIAVGISGAIQHLAGMKDSKTIVAINTDPDAPIFEVADYGLVMDLFVAVPELTEKLKAK